MDDVENQGVIDGNVQPSETEAQQERQQDQPKIDNRTEISWAKEIERKEARFLRELEKRDQMLEKLINQVSQPQAKVEPEEEFDNDEYIPAGKVKALVEKRAAIIARQEAENMMKAQHQNQWKSRLQSQYPDFDQVVNPQTLELLSQQDPELANTIVELKDPYKIGLQSYKFIKASGILEKSPNERRVKEVEDKLEKNAKSVQSPQAFEKRPMAQAFQMTSDMKKELQKEMQQYASMVGFGY